jgi:hypothetical protein
MGARQIASHVRRRELPAATLDDLELDVLTNRRRYLSAIGEGRQVNKQINGRFRGRLALAA